jgi:hypothetical protein
MTNDTLNGLIGSRRLQNARELGLFQPSLKHLMFSLAQTFVVFQLQAPRTFNIMQSADSLHGSQRCESDALSS